MHSSPKVSVIVPVFNVEKYVEKCLNSLIVQTWENLEIIVIDDGSTDKSAEIINIFTERFSSKIKTVQQKNQGLSAARNAGLEICTGDYIGFVDGDDFVAAEMFEEMIHLAQIHDADMVICNLQKVDTHGNVIEKLPQIPNSPEFFCLSEYFSVFSDLSYFACNKLFRKDLFAGLRFTAGLHFEDIELIPKLLLRCSTLAQTQNYYYQYFVREDSISKSHTQKGTDIFLALENVEKAFNRSAFSHHKSVLKDFQILQGVYSFVAYLAFVKDDAVFKKMDAKFKEFIKSRGISLKDILLYSRFGKNYLLSLPLKKKIFYLLYFGGQKRLIRKLLKH